MLQRGARLLKLLLTGLQGGLHSADLLLGSFNVRLCRRQCFGAFLLRAFVGLLGSLQLSCERGDLRVLRGNFRLLGGKGLCHRSELLCGHIQGLCCHLQLRLCHLILRPGIGKLSFFYLCSIHCGLGLLCDLLSFCLRSVGSGSAGLSFCLGIDQLTFLCRKLRFDRRQFICGRLRLGASLLQFLLCSLELLPHQLHGSFLLVALLALGLQLAADVLIDVESFIADLGQLLCELGHLCLRFLCASALRSR
mmetsp:Transcript_23588/g.54827  ORF Transcript_23588/g.54827 Transcript_23588/m.54827 type:complete len:250 (-) Transcript_23588:1252-2001(-)